MSTPCVPMKVRRVGFARMKGARHVSVPEIVIDRDGPVGDREWCLVDVAKQRVVRTVADPMVGATVAVTRDGLEVDMRDGRSASGPVHPSGPPMEVDYWGRHVVVTPYDGVPARLLVEQVGRPEVCLARAERGDVVYGASVSLVGTASLEDLADRMGRGEPADQPERFRATVVVETSEPWVEDTWLGQVLVIGGAVVRGEGRIGRCGVPNLHPLTGEADTPVLKALAGFRPSNEAGEPYLGIDASVVRSGTVRPGDTVALG